MNTRSSPATSATIGPSSPAKRGRWRDWQPAVQPAADSAASIPAAAAPAAGGFVSATADEPPTTPVEPDPADVAHASAVLNQAGVRMIHFDDVRAIGIWSDLDGPVIRKALQTLGKHGPPVRYLDGADVPARYKLRLVEGEAVPTHVLAEMQREPKEPWKVRDRMLQEMGWGAETSSWAQWKAAELNRLFHQQGVTGQPGRITAATVLQGERQQQRQDSILAVSAKPEPTKPTKPPLEQGSL